MPTMEDTTNTPGYQDLGGLMAMNMLVCCSPTRKSMVTKRYSEFCTGCGVSPRVVRVSMDQ